jgi:rhamnulokinase/L-fuculokinase
MTKKQYLVADIGASNGRISRGCFDGNKLDLELVHRFENIPVTAGKHLYWDYFYIYREIKNGIKKAASGFDIISLAIDTWNIDFALIGKDGRLIFNPIHYRDPARSDPVLKDIYREISIEEIFKITGWNPAYLVAAPYFLYYLKKKYSYILKNTSKFLMMPDLFNYFLTGEYFTEYSIASGSLMLDYRTGTWDEKLLNITGLKKDTMPRILDTGVSASRISKEVSRELDITPFNIATCASHDTASAVASIPAKRGSWAFLGTGTWFMLGIETREKIMDEGVINNLFSNEGGASGSNFFAKNTSAGLWVLQECRKKWNSIHNKEFKWEEIAGLAEDAGPVNTVLDIEDPVFTSGNKDMLKTIYDYCKKTYQENPETIGKTAYIILKSLALTVNRYLVELKAFTGQKIEALHMIGGGVYNDLLCQMIANSTNMTILAGPAEAASMGNFMMQLKASGDIKDIAEGRELITNSIEIKEYHPQDRAYWQEEYGRFIGILEAAGKTGR